MKCAWQAYLNLLPAWMQRQTDVEGKDRLQELRLRLSYPPEMVLGESSRWLDRPVTEEDLRFVINAASRYSPWAAATMEHGYITAVGGHRVGLCGEAVVQNGNMSGIRRPASLCIRVARDFPGIAREALRYPGSVLILGKPGSGKTTLLRDLIRQRSEAGSNVAVVDERGELFPRSQEGNCFIPGSRTDILTGCGKPKGVEVLLRTMGPDVIAVDEITAEEDCVALMHAGWCGVNLLATAHAAGYKDLMSRPIYRILTKSRLFQTLLVMQPDKSWRAERMEVCT